MVLKLRDPDLFCRKAPVGGRWCDALSGQTLVVTNPATGQALGQVPLMGREDTLQAIGAAQAALPSWRALTARERSDILMRWYDLILEAREDLARIMTAEQGKPLAEALGEVSYAASFVRWFAEEGPRAYGDIIPTPAPGQRYFVTREPVGVCAAITPWNFPLAMITRKVAPAFAVGCTMVLKPAGATPYSALALARLAERAGLPPGVLNVVTGPAEEIGQVLCESPVVRKLSFTGSTAVGSRLMAQCAPTLKRLSLELGGNAPFLVFDDADLERAVRGAVTSKYRNSGQTCICTNRFLVQSGIYDAFAEALASATAALKVGDGMEEGVTQGPLINDLALSRVVGQVTDAVTRGARILSGGHPHALGGTFFEPTVLADVEPSMKIASEETFGPVAPLFRFETEEEAVALANDTRYGLAAYLFTRDSGRMVRVSEALEFGMVGINTGTLSTEVAPFGGIKASGFGREGSRYGLDEYTELKYTCLSGL
ncbi:NAD-dependent succinate-semialdehyde dehydrogenase [Phaeovibrio sulfidiphilus]|uniref:NAD-dependent succinate-semialdehyde dehydrogenase n=1 Tax=Phaeovibrio sulfidiphilus TaxID=1220600 RepID=A0A8J6YTI3_9PROT|nr:NAD-dependent succinate-semialdehyde dehydrogenase [Phaeovibrio sulfidiphilus]MBE1236134.1 NAD-dependent succinate-semialdehyde dehydrogenase [Phaeovibrio sulfidiphilus]